MDMIKIIVAFDSWKDCLTAGQACYAAAEGFARTSRDVVTDVHPLPLADGGEGTLGVLAPRVGGKMVPVEAHDALMRPLSGPYLMLSDGKSAVVELASTCGLSLLKTGERNAMRTTTYGLGQQIAAAIAAGAADVTCTLGGSASNDAGLGALQALGLLVYVGDEVLRRPVTGADLVRVTGFDDTELRKNLSGVKLRYLYDANIPFLGDRGAVRMYAAQKGANAADLELLEDGMMNVAGKMTDVSGRNPEDYPGAGASGGAGGGFVSLAGAEPMNGIEFILDTVKFEEMLRGANLVITGEGKADAQTRQGKAADGVLRRAKAAGVPVILMAGQIENREQLEADGYARIININESQNSPRMIFPEGDALDPTTAFRRIYYSAAMLNIGSV